jgi:eukaryotic-like serine/threonine-protein kinase
VTSSSNYGRYVLLERIGGGSLTDVFKAKSFGVEGFEKTLVIKRLLPRLSSSERFVQGFVRQAKLAVRLSHANVVQVFDMGRVEEADGASYFLAMEYVAGSSLAELLDRLRSSGTVLPLGLCLYVASEVAKALDHAHKRRDDQLRPLEIVHGDVSPRNVLLSWDGEVKLSDFCIARALYDVQNATLAELEQLSRKAAYGSPELVTAAAVGPSSDVFALGTLLYELLSGKQPFLGAGYAATTRNVLSAAHPPLEQLRADLPPELSALVERALAPEPDRRGPVARVYEELLALTYTSGARFGAAELSDLLEQQREAPPAPPESLLEHSQPFDLSAVAASTPPRSAAPDERPRAQAATLSGVDLADAREASALVLQLSGAAPVPPALHERARQILTRYGGRVLADSPREISAMFGLSQADSRDTENAVRSGLVLLRSLGAGELSASVGVDSGRLRAVDGRPAEDGRTRELLAGARRIAQAASGQVAVAARAARNLRGLFVLEPLDAREPAMVVGELRPAQAAFGRFVGRKSELRWLGELIARAGRGELGVLGLIGEHGTGKTRLLLEMDRRIQRGGFNIACYVASCPPRGRELPYSALASMLRMLCGLRDGDPPDRALEIEPRLRALGLRDEEVQAVLGELGLSEAPDAARASLKSGVTRMFASLAEDRLHVFAWDGAEEIDAGSAEILGAAAERLASSRTLLLFSARPGSDARFRSLPGYLEIALGDLEEEDAFRLVALRLGVDEVPQALLSFVQERAGGHPMFIEELLFEALDSGAVVLREGKVESLRLGGSLSIPRSLSALVGDRVRRLPDEQRSAMIAAAVLGQPVDVAVLAAMLELPVGRVHELVEPLVQKELLTTLGPVTLGFRTPLVHAVVLSGLEPDSAVELHLRAANAYQNVLATRTEEESARIARHLAEAGERDRAAGFYATSGLFCLSAHRLDRAVADLTRALDLADVETRSPDELAEWVSSLSHAIRHVRAGAGIPDVVQRMATHFASHESVPDRLRAQTAVDLALVLTALHRYKEARRLLQGAVESGAQWPELRRAALTAEAEIGIRIGEFKPALDALEKALQAGARTSSEEHRLLIATAQALSGTGQLDQALDALDQAEQLDAGADPVLTGERGKIRALILGFRGDWQGCALASEAAAEQMRAAGLVHEVAVNLHNQGDALLRGGELPRAYATLQASLAAAEEIGSDRLVNLNQMLLAYLDALNGAQPAKRLLGDRIAQAEAQRWTWDTLTGRYLLGKLLGQSGDVEAARRELELTRQMAASMGNRLLVDDCDRALEELA